jgi:hypothetical protein
MTNILVVYVKFKTLIFSGFQMDEPPPITQRTVEEFSYDPGSGSDTSESSAHAIAPGEIDFCYIWCFSESRNVENNDPKNLKLPRVVFRWYCMNSSHTDIH